MQGGHLARRLFEGLLEEEKAAMRKEAVGSGGLIWSGGLDQKDGVGGGGKRKQPGGGGDGGDVGDGDGIGGGALVDIEVSEQCLALRCMDSRSRLRALLDHVDRPRPQAAGESKGPLHRLFANMDALTVEILTHAWEHCSETEAESQATAFERLWGSFQDGGADARRLLMAKKEEFAKTAMTRVVERVLGFP